MSTGSDMRERHERVLAEMAEAGMVMVRGLSAAREAAADPAAQVQVGLAYHRVSRAVRQTIALEFRLAQAADRAAREPAAPRPAVTPAQTPEARPSPERGDWYEYERAEADEALEDLDVLLEADDADPEAVHAAVESCIVRIRHDLDLAPPTLRRSISSPVGGGGPREAGWRGNRSSSARPADPLVCWDVISLRCLPGRPPGVAAPGGLSVEGPMPPGPLGPWWSWAAADIP